MIYSKRNRKQAEGQLDLFGSFVKSDVTSQKPSIKIHASSNLGVLNRWLDNIGMKHDGLPMDDDDDYYGGQY